MVAIERSRELTLDDIDFMDPDKFQQRGYPFAQWDLLRREAPVYRYERDNDGPFYAITRHQDIHRISRDPKTFSSDNRLILPGEAGERLAGLKQLNRERAIARGEPDPDVYSQRDPTILGMDPPQHGIYRNLVARRFAPRALRELEPHVEELAARYVDDAAKALVDAMAEGTSCDFVAEVAMKLPLTTICEMMNIPREDHDLMIDLTNRTIGSTDPEFVPDPADRGRATQELFGYFAALIQKRIDDGLKDDDLISVLLRARVDGQPLSHEYLLSYCQILIIAGNETTRNATAGGMLALLQHPDQYERLRNDPSLLPGAIEEILRWTSPVIHFPRTATSDVEIQGVTVRAGEVVRLFYPSANRDEQLFDDPYTFDITRSPNDHLAFGGFGEHFCLGSNLARLELRTTFRELFKRVDEMELAGEPARLRSNFIGGIKHLPVRYRVRG